MTAPVLAFDSLHQTLFVRDGCIEGQTWGSAIPETGQHGHYHPVAYMVGEPSPLMRRITT